MRPRSFPHRSFALAAVLALAGCGGSAKDESGALPEPDPAVGRALNAALMSDPDLSGLNEANAALSGPGDEALPRVLDTPEAIRDATDRALRLTAGATESVTLPDPAPLAGGGDGSPLVLLEEVVASEPAARACLPGSRYSARWAAQLPEALPVYPRGTVIEALGRSGPPCTLQAVRFVSPVPADAIRRFYHVMAGRAGFSLRYSAGEDAWRIEGRRSGARLVIEGRESLLGGHEVDLVHAVPSPR